MKKYLELIPIMAKQHRKQNRMTRLCIIMAVFLVTVIFGMSDMEMRSQFIQAVKTDGSWHAGFVMDEEQGEILKERPEIEQIARYGTLNYDLKDGYQIDGTETVICGFDKELMKMFPETEYVEGRFPKNADEAVLNERAAKRLKLREGDSIELTVPEGRGKQYRITGIRKDTALEAEHDAFGMFLNMEGFCALRPEETEAAQEVLYYVKFRRFCNIQKAISEIRRQFGLKDKQVAENAKVLMLLFQSRDRYLMSFYFVAVILAVLVVIAGIFMIAASMNSNIAQRTEFFGMLRCLGATRKQVIHFVKIESLFWCRTAIPAGVLAGVFIVWGLCGMLRYLSPGLFEGLPVFGVSWPGVAAGILVGFLTVLLAAGAPAKRAAKVSPLAAVSGNAGTMQAVKRAAHTRFIKVDTALGIHHASGSKKNFFLVTGSFAFSIILFLSFSTAVDFMNHALTPLRPSAPDISILRKDDSYLIGEELLEELKTYPGVKYVFGRNYAKLDVPSGGESIRVISYHEQQFELEEKSLLEGNLKEVSAGEGVLSVAGKENLFTLGSRISILADGKEREVVVKGVLGNVPYMNGNSAGTLVCSEKIFKELTGEAGYAELDIQLERGADDLQVEKIRKAAENMCGDSVSFSDKRAGNQEVKGAGYSMSLFIYGFLAVIALIAFFNIINCIAMGVSARMKEYGAMRAIGMSVRQLIRMVAGEAFAYTVFGAALGCAVGLPLNRFLFHILVTGRWGDAWSLPVWEMSVIAAVMLCSVCVAVMGPAVQIRKMTGHCER